MSNSAPGDSKTSGSADNPVPGATVPGKIDRCLDVIRYNPDGELILLGASSLTTTLWRGSIWILKDENIPVDTSLKVSPADCWTGISMEAGVSSGMFLSNTKVLVGCDSGSMHVHEVKGRSGEGDTNKSGLELVGSCSEHSSSIMDMDMLGSENEVVSCSEDKSIKVWDIQRLQSLHTYSPAHSRTITGVKTQPNSSHTFVSVALDSSALMWDIRQDKPASWTFGFWGLGITAVTWISPFELVFGAVSGDLVTVDTRMTTRDCVPSISMKRPIHRLESCPQEPDLVAVSQDSSQFSVIKFKESSSASSVYQDDRHEDFVRYVTWNPAKKHTAIICSWDSTVSKHSISLDKSINGF